MGRSEMSTGLPKVTQPGKWPDQDSDSKAHVPELSPIHEQKAKVLQTW